MGTQQDTLGKTIAAKAGYYIAYALLLTAKSDM